MQLRMSKKYGQGGANAPVSAKGGENAMGRFILNLPDEQILHDLAISLMQSRGVPDDADALIVAYNEAVSDVVEAYNS